MPYVPQIWANSPSGGTALSAARLNYMEAGIEDANEVLAPVINGDPAETLTAIDLGRTIRYTNAALVTVTLPTDGVEDLIDGFWAMLYAEGAGGVTLSTAGITLTGNTPNKTIAQNEAMVVMKTASANTWMVIGATS